MNNEIDQILDEILKDDNDLKCLVKKLIAEIRYDIKQEVLDEVSDRISRSTSGNYGY